MLAALRSQEAAMSRFVLRRILTAIAITCAAVTALPLAHARHSESSIIYTISNAAAGNELLAFRQGSNGTLTPLASHATGGLGSGSGLGNQGAVVSDGEHIFVVNPGSDDLSVFRVRKSGVRLVDTIASGGVRPISVTVHHDLVYVLNAGSDSIAGFRLGKNGRLRVLSGSEQPLSGTGTDPAQIQFSADGDTVIVTEKATNNIVLYSLGHRGVPEARSVVPSVGQTPFGFALAKGRLVIVSEAAGGATNASSVSSYWLGRDGDLRVIDATDPTLQSAACWVVVTRDGRFAYVTNTGSNSVSGFRIFAGHLFRLNRDGITATTGAAPIDMALSRGVLHVLNSGDHTISSFRVLKNGQLARIGEVVGLPDAATGLLAL
jgi:6-phosphogluconolactonase (cycloisomerase 2 family)